MTGGTIGRCGRGGCTGVGLIGVLPGVLLAGVLSIASGCINHDRTAATRPADQATGETQTLATTRSDPSADGATQVASQSGPIDANGRLELAQQLADSVDYQSILNDLAAQESGQSSGRPSRATPPPESSGVRTPPASAVEAVAAQVSQQAEEQTAAAIDTDGPAGSDQLDQSADERITELVGELGALLRERAVGGILEPTATGPLPDYLRLALLKGIDPAAVGDRDRLEAEMRRTLVDAEAAHVEAAIDLAEAWVKAADSGSVTPVLEAIDRASESLRDASGLLQTRVVLCTSVEGYGKINSLDRSTFLAGQPNRVIVYTELDGFAHRPLTEDDSRLARARGDQHAVEVSQKLTLFHAPSGDLQAWHDPWRRIIDTSRNRQRDFYLVNQIDLPARLSVGRYVLKVTTRDEVTGAEDEQILPIRFVADSRLLDDGSPK